MNRCVAVVTAVLAIVASATAQQPESRGVESTATRPAEAGFDLYVLREATFAPAPGATVQVITEGTSRPVELIADEKGVVRLPASAESKTVRGRSGNLEGEVWVRRDPRQRLLLPLRAPIEVVVVDGAGAPANGVPLALVQWVVRDLSVVETKKTDPEGAATLSYRDVGTRRVAVAFAIPLEAPTEEPVDAGRERTEPIKLVLPPTSPVTVKLVAIDGTPFLGAATVELVAANDSATVAGGRRFRELSARTKEGTVTFPWVGAAPRLFATVKPRDTNLRTNVAVVEGGRAPGVETTVTIGCGGLATIIKGRLVGAGKTPLGNVHFEAWLPEPPASGCAPFATENRSRFSATDQDGRFTLRFDLDPAALTVKDLLVDVDLRRPGAVAGYVNTLRSFSVPLPIDVRTGSVDLGDIVVPVLPLIATGTVVSNQGVPIPHADVSLIRRRRGEWTKAREEYSVVGSTGADGRFELRGSARGDDLGLIAVRPFWICVEPTKLGSWSASHEVVMRPAGGLRGSLKGIDVRRLMPVDPSSPIKVLVSGDQVAVSIRNLGIAHDCGDRLGLDILDGRFETRELLPGTYAVEVVAPGAAAPIVRVQGIVVEAGKVTEHADLQGVDVSKHLHSRVVTVVDEQGNPVRTAAVHARDPRGESGGFVEFQTDRDGRATILTPAAVVEIVATCEGHQTARVATVENNATIVLARRPPHVVTLKLDDSTALPAPPFSFGADLRWLCETGSEKPAKPDWNDPRHSIGGIITFGCDRTAVLRVQCPGVYEVHLWLNEEKLLSGGASHLRQKGLSAIVTVPESGPLSAIVMPDPAALKQAIERARIR